MKASTPTGRWGPCCSIAATGRTATTLLMSVAAKSRQLISAQNLVGGMRISRRSRLARGDGFDLDLEFGPSEPLDDHQSRSRGRTAHKFVTHLHISSQILGRGDIGVEANEIGKRHRRLAKDCDDGAKAKTRLSLDIVGNDAVAANSQLAGAENDARSGRNYHAMGVSGERR